MERKNLYPILGNTQFQVGILPHLLLGFQLKEILLNTNTNTYTITHTQIRIDRYMYRVSQKKCLIVIFFRATRPDFLELIFQLILVKYEFGTPEKYSEDLEKFCVQADLVVNLGQG